VRGRLARFGVKRFAVVGLLFALGVLFADVSSASPDTSSADLAGTLSGPTTGADSHVHAVSLLDALAFERPVDAG